MMLYGYPDRVGVKITDHNTLLAESLTQSDPTTSGNLFREQFAWEFVSITRFLLITLSTLNKALLLTCEMQMT